MKKEKTTETVEFHKIKTNTRDTINETLELGQYLRNGGGRLFEIIGLDEEQIVLKSLNPDNAEGGTGTTKTDQNGYTLTFTSQSSVPAYGIDESIISGLI